MSEPRCLRPVRPLPGVLIGAVVACAAPAVALGAGAAAGPASNPTRSTTMASNPATGAFTHVQLKGLVGETIGPWKQVGLEVPLAGGPLPQPPTLVYTFRHAKQTATLTVADGGAQSSAPGPAHWTGPPNRRTTDRGAEHVYREGRHTVREIERREKPPAREVVVLFTNGITVTAAGDADIKTLKALAAGVPVAAAEALVRPPK